MKKKQNSIPEYVIEELIPRFRGIDTPTIANVKCDFLNMNGNFIMSKSSEEDYDELHLNADNTMFGRYDIALCSDKDYLEIKESYENNKDNRYDEVDGLLTTFRHSISNGVTYVTFDGFEKHFKINVLRKGFGIDIKKNYKFDKSKLKVNEVFKITAGKLTNNIECYGILMEIRDTSLVFKMPSNPYNREDSGSPYEYICDIKWIIDETIKLERVEL